MYMNDINDVIDVKREPKTSLALDKEFRAYIAGLRNQYLVDNKLTHMSIEDYLKEKLGYVAKKTGN